jgi:drug/metabolite transporter superfamily protein YnfA
MWINSAHAIVAVIILAALDRILTGYAVRRGFREANPVTRWLMTTFGIVPGLLVGHYLPIAGAVLVWHFTRDVRALAWIVDGCIAFGLASIWDAWQLHKAGRV